MMREERKRRGRPAKHPLVRSPEFTAAVRFRDGRRELFRVRLASDIADARALVIAELSDVTSVVIAERAGVEPCGG